MTGIDAQSLAEILPHIKDIDYITLKYNKYLIATVAVIAVIGLIVGTIVVLDAKYAFIHRTASTGKGKLCYRQRYSKPARQLEDLTSVTMSTSDTEMASSQLSFLKSKTNAGGKKRKREDANSH